MSETHEKDIGDYAMIGDLCSAALVSKAGAIEWLCAPYFDSGACFAALLGTEENGHWTLAPRGTVSKMSRRYLEDTLILETRFDTPTGSVAVIDFMPAADDETNLVRIVKGLSGQVEMSTELLLRLDYGRVMPWIYPVGGGRFEAIAGPHRLTVGAPVTCTTDDGNIRGTFTISENEERAFTLSYSSSFDEPHPPIDVADAFRTTQSFWTDWAAKCTYEGRWRDTVMRSLITLKALTFAPTGGMAAAATTSLPEQPGGERNWDYRFCWLRDATFVLMTLMEAGYGEEAEAWQRWLLRAVAGNASEVQPVYTIFGDSRIEEVEIDWLDGFNGARPVRVGNAAYKQSQHDKIGEVIDTLFQARKYKHYRIDRSWELQKALLHRLEEAKDEPGRGIWEVRGPKRHFVHSKVMSWVAFDRAVRMIDEDGVDGPRDHWARLRDELHDEICEHGYNAERNTFVQAYGSSELDAATLMIPIVGFLPPDDPRVAGTVAAIEKGLMDNGLVMRYQTHSSDDGLPPGEGVFLACSFWLVDNYVLLGRMDDAIALFEYLVSLTNDVGLLAEEYDCRLGQQLGNFPQALSHLSLIGSALNIARHHSPAEHRSEGAKST